MNFVISNWAELALAVLTAAGTITALTETEKDDKIVNVLKRAFCKPSYSERAEAATESGSQVMALVCFVSFNVEALPFGGASGNQTPRGSVHQPCGRRTSWTCFVASGIRHQPRQVAKPQRRLQRQRNNRHGGLPRDARPTTPHRMTTYLHTQSARCTLEA